MKVLTALQMREVDRLTIARGIPGIILMENAGARVVEFLAAHFAPLREQRITVVCGKGNNGGDGLVIARQLAIRFQPAALAVVLAFPPSEFQGDALVNFQMLSALGLPVLDDFPPHFPASTLVIDALLGTGLSGPACGKPLDWIRAINTRCPLARIVAVDIPSGLHHAGESVRADHTVTFTAPKVEQVMPPACDRSGALHVVPIGSPPELFDQDPSLWLHLSTAADFAPLLVPRARGAHKGDFGHVLVIGGATGKGGAAAMSGLAALRAGAGLVTVATAPDERGTVTAIAPELMTQVWTDAPANKDVLALGPGLGLALEAVSLAQRLYAESALPAIVDADGLNALASTPLPRPPALRILTPHPGEMARLAGLTTPQVQADRLGVARSFAQRHGVILVLKGQRTLVALPDGRVWINPTGTPAMATAGSGDILTGLIAGLLAQFPSEPDLAVRAAVWLHGRAGELGAAAASEQSLIATDLLRYLPEALRDLHH